MKSVLNTRLVGSMLLKQMYSLGDETFVLRWFENPYWSRIFGTRRFTFNMKSHMIRLILCISVNKSEKREQRKY